MEREKVRVKEIKNCSKILHQTTMEQESAKSEQLQVIGHRLGPFQQQRQIEQTNGGKLWVRVAFNVVWNFNTPPLILNGGISKVGGRGGEGESKKPAKAIAQSMDTESAKRDKSQPSEAPQRWSVN